MDRGLDHSIAHECQMFSIFTRKMKNLVASCCPLGIYDM